MRTSSVCQKGFTMIELVIVMGILGVLGSIGMATFEDMVTKARQNEAKSHLVIVYSGMRNFHSEWNQYFGDWYNIGVEIRGVISYRVGFHVFAGLDYPTSPAEYIGPGVQAGGQAVAVNTNHAGSYCGPGKQCQERNQDRACGIWNRDECTWNNDDGNRDWFRVCACGKVNDPQGGGAMKRDRWSLDQSKTWDHYQVDDY